jgi:hypothetical protein
MYESAKLLSDFISVSLDRNPKRQLCLPTPALSSLSSQSVQSRQHKLPIVDLYPKNLREHHWQQTAGKPGIQMGQAAESILFG